MKYLFIILLAMTSAAQAKSKSATCAVTTGDGDITPITVVSGPKTIDEDTLYTELQFGDLVFNISLMEGKRLIATSGAVMVQGYNYLYYGDASKNLKLECTVR